MIRELTPEEGRALFDRKARKLMGMSGEEFLRRWDAGEYLSLEDEDVNAQSLATLIPFARRFRG